MKKRVTLRGKNEGASILAAIIIMLVLMVLALSMLLAAYSVFHTAMNQRDFAQCEELAQDVSLVLEQQLTQADFSSFEEMRTIGEDAQKANAYALWYYLRCNLCQESWPYYCEGENGHDRAYADRYFTLEHDWLDTEHQQALEESYDEIFVRIYYENPENSKESENADISVVIEVTVSKGTQKCVISSTYGLQRQKDIDGYGNQESICLMGDYNPLQCEIASNEKWTFYRKSRG